MAVRNGTGNLNRSLYPLGKEGKLIRVKVLVFLAVLFFTESGNVFRRTGVLVLRSFCAVVNSTETVIASTQKLLLSSDGHPPFM